MQYMKPTFSANLEIFDALKLCEARNFSVTRNLNFAAALLKALHTRLGSCIEKARPYYEALEQMMRAQAECQQAAVQFQRAAGQYRGWSR
jgi:hypothetical protein